MPEFNENPRPRPPDPYEGRVIDKYMLISKLGTGGMGLVYRAEQIRIKRQVAIKLLSAKLIHDQVNVKRIEREAAAMGNLRHPNIATFHDFGISDGQPYLVMELIAGRSLGDLLDEQKRLEPERVITIAAQVADAMAYAHKQGLVHRDLKPDNIMLDNEHTNDFAKVLDFGIAKTAEDLSLTKSGVLIGSPLYMSPEQCRGSKLDARSDIYSLGVIIYEALTGLVPCKGETLIETLSRKTMEQAPPFPPEFSEWSDLERLTLACLATEPEDRPQSMSIVRDELFAMVNPGSISMSLSSLGRSRGPRSTGTNTGMDAPTRSSRGSTSQPETDGSDQSRTGGSTGSRTGGSTHSRTGGSTESRTGARRPARSTQSRTSPGRLTQNQTQSQLHGHPPVLDETGQIYKPVVSAKQMIVMGTAIGAMYLMSVVAIAAWYVGFDEGNGPKSFWSGSKTQNGSNSASTGSNSGKSSSNGNSNANGTANGSKGNTWNGTANGSNGSGSNGMANGSNGSGASNSSQANNNQQTSGTASGTNNSGQKQNQSETTLLPPAQSATNKSHKPPSSKPEIKVVKTVVKTKHQKLSPFEQAHRQPVQTYRYGSSTDNSDASNYDQSTSRPAVTFGRNVYINRQAARIQAQAEADRQAHELQMKALQAAAEERAAAANATAAARAAGNRRFNDLDAGRRQYGGGSQWGKDTGSSYYGNGNF